MISFSLLLFAGSLYQARAQSSTQAQIAFTAFKDGQWDIFSITPDGLNLRQLTYDLYEDAAPAFSPDGTKLAYASHRDRNWDIYLLDLASGVETRLTDNPEYDGAPAWHPSGEALAFESYRSRDPDIWVLDAPFDGVPRNVTADSPAGEFSPAWDDRGQLFFASWRGGDNDIWALDPDTGLVEQLTSNAASETQPVWNAVRQQLSFTRNTLGEKDVWIVDAAGNENQQTWLGSITEATFSPDGATLAAIWRDYDGAYLIRLDKGNPVPFYLTSKIALREGISWRDNAVVAGSESVPLGGPDPSPLYAEILTPSNSPGGEPYDLIRLNDLQTGGDPWLADTVDDSYRALRIHLRDEVGYDFIGTVSETMRPVSVRNDTSQYSSWHKSGRAVDTLFDLSGGRLEIVKENIGGEVYWRMFLRCENQTGRCGRPITTKTWDYSYTARTELAPDQGGVERANQYGYYIDFTELAQLYGWQRIASYDDEEFGWTWHFKAFEYWHYQKQNGVSNWYQAVRQIYPKDKVDQLFNWETMRAADEDPYLIILKGVSPAPEAAKWWRQVTIRH